MFNIAWLVWHTICLSSSARDVTQLMTTPGRMWCDFDLFFNRPINIVRMLGCQEIVLAWFLNYPETTISCLLGVKFALNIFLIKLSYEGKENLDKKTSEHTGWGGRPIWHPILRHEQRSEADTPKMLLSRIGNYQSSLQVIIVPFLKSCHLICFTLLGWFLSKASPSQHELGKVNNFHWIESKFICLLAPFLVK